MGLEIDANLDIYHYTRSTINLLDTHDCFIKDRLDVYARYAMMDYLCARSGAKTKQTRAVTRKDFNDIPSDIDAYAALVLYKQLDVHWFR